MENILIELTKFIEETRKNNPEVPYLSDFEEGCREGKIDAVDDLERIISKYTN